MKGKAGNFLLVYYGVWCIMGDIHANIQDMMICMPGYTRTYMNDYCLLLVIRDHKYVLSASRSVVIVTAQLNLNMSWSLT